MFDDSVESFIDRIKKRAVEKAKEMVGLFDMFSVLLSPLVISQAADKAKRAAETEGDAVSPEGEVLSKEERMGPGGLDPVEVFESLPESMQDAFESQDTAALQVESV